MDDTESLIVSIIVCSYDHSRIDSFKQLLNSIKNQVCQEYELIVIPDPVGLGKARNLGIQQSKGDLIAFVDDDAYLDPFWVKRVLNVFEIMPAIDGCTGRIIPYPEPDRHFPKSLYWMIGADVSNKFKNHSIGHGTNMIFRREALFIHDKQVVFFQDNFTPLGKEKNGLVGDDVDFQLKLKGSIVYEPSIIVYHNCSNKITNSYIRHYAYWQGISERRFDLLYGKQGKEKRKVARYKFDLLLDLLRSFPYGWYKLFNAYSAGIVGYIYAFIFQDHLSFIYECN